MLYWKEDALKRPHELYNKPESNVLLGRSLRKHKRQDKDQIQSTIIDQQELNNKVKNGSTVKRHIEHH